MDSVKYKSAEFVVVFILIPVGFVLNYSAWLKMAIGLIGFIYIIYVLLYVEKEKFKISKNLNWKLFFKQTAIKFLGIASVTTLFVWLTNGALLFSVPINKPKLWLLILCAYMVFSVYPQELVYRTFYFKRYRDFFRNKNLCIFINATVFSLGHLFFKNTLVLVLTFLGGLLFAITFFNTKSTFLVSIEHAIYGCWLFTVGMGDMLGFPA